MMLTWYEMKSGISKLLKIIIAKQAIFLLVYFTPLQGEWLKNDIMDLKYTLFWGASRVENEILVVVGVVKSGHV